MARGLSKVLLIGNLGKDPEMKYTPQGKPVATFSLAVSRSWKGNDGEWKDETEWFRIVAWDKLAETCNEYLRKGSKVYVEGRLQTRKWEGQDGQPREIGRSSGVRPCTPGLSPGGRWSRSARGRRRFRGREVGQAVGCRLILEWV